MEIPSVVYSLYERSLLKGLNENDLPSHVGVILDGNRRWARASGLSASDGHRKGADKIVEFLTWCEEVHIPLVTLWLLSTDNLKRDPQELQALGEVICQAAENLASIGRWRLHMVGALDLLPEEFAERLRAVELGTAHIEGQVEVNIAVSYGGRQEIADAVRGLLREANEQGRTLDEVAETISVDDIARHLYTRGQPDPDLVIRTSGEIRMSGFMLWQTVHTELYFCETYWPDFRRTDFLRALRDYCLRERRLGK